jgi:hypothetical protein
MTISHPQQNPVIPNRAERPVRKLLPFSVATNSAKISA